MPYEARVSPSKGNPTDPTFASNVPLIHRTRGKCEWPQHRRERGSSPSISRALASVVRGKNPSLFERGDPWAIVTSLPSGPGKESAIESLRIHSTESRVNSAVHLAGSQL